MKHYIQDDTYVIEDNGKVVFTVSLDYELHQVVIKTSNEVYAGPIDEIYFKESR